MESKNVETIQDQFTSRASKEASREQLERLLILAEHLEEKRNLSIRQEALLNVVDIYIYISTIMVMIITCGYIAHNLNYVPAYIKVVTGFIPCFALTWIIMLRNWRKRVSIQAFSDELALGETVELLREVQPLVAQREQWSALDQVAFRIRLSRFEIFPSRPRAQHNATSSTQEQSSSFTTPVSADLRSSIDNVQNTTVTLQNH